MATVHGREAKGASHEPQVAGAGGSSPAAHGAPGTARPTALAFTWRKLIVATGARELFLPFPGWTLPNVVGAGGLSALVKGGLPVRGKRVVVAGSGPLLIAVAAELRRHGAKVACIAEQAGFRSLLRFGLKLPWLAPAKLAQAIGYQYELLGVPFRTHCWPVQAMGHDRVEAVVLTDGDRRWTEPCDYVACGFGLVPNLELPQLLGCRVENGAVQVNRLGETSLSDVFCAGEPTGIGGAERAVLEGQIAGLAAAGREAAASRLLPARARQQRFAEALARAFALRPELKDLSRPDTTICRCEDVPHAALECCHGWHEAKLHTRCGMGPCQGRVCGGATRFLYGWDHNSTRPPILPVSLGALRWSEPPSR
jgi:NADPH-dependent 2,4-dienoyl-CoA reductase/sulfur reductase-like enzyme